MSPPVPKTIGIQAGLKSMTQVTRPGEASRKRWPADRSGLGWATWTWALDAVTQPIISGAAKAEYGPNWHDWCRCDGQHEDVYRFRLRDHGPGVGQAGAGRLLCRLVRALQDDGAGGRPDRHPVRRSADRWQAGR